MKRIEDIEKMTAEELEAVANDAGLPEAKAGAREVIAKLEIAEEAKGRSPRKVYIGWISGIAATFIVMLGIGLALQSRGPKDTFDDPVLAYAQVQSVLQQISSGMQQGKAAVDESGQMIADEFEKTIIKIK